MRCGDLSGLILQYIRIGALQNARRSALKSRSMFTQFGTSSSCFDSDQRNLLITNELVKSAHCVRSAADAGDHRIRQLGCLRENLLASLAADATMKIAYHFWIRMRSDYRAEQLMRGADVCDPIAHGFIDGVFQRA